MNYSVSLGGFNSIFIVPNKVVDDCIKLATGNALKVLLYTLRNNDNNISIDTYKSKLGLSNEAVEEALVFWEHMGILTNPEQSIDIQNSTEISKPVESQIQENLISASNLTLKPNPSIKVSSAGYLPDPSEIVERINNSSDIQNILTLAETIMGETIGYNLQRCFIWIYDYYGLSSDVILMIIQYCVSIGKRHQAYIEKVAYDWYSRGIDTIEKANEEMLLKQKFHTYSNRVKNIIGLATNFTDEQSEFISLWHNEGYSIDLIKFAYDKNINQISKLSFKYMNSILESWKINQLKTVEEVKSYELNNPKTNSNKYSKTKKYRFTDASNRQQSYSLEQYESFAVLERGDVEKTNERED